MRKILIIIGGVLFLTIIGLVVWQWVIPKMNPENRQIDAWIKTNNLNKYGDQQNTVYSNGKPCNNTLKCYDYIKKLHSDNPWDK